MADSRGASPTTWGRVAELQVLDEAIRRATEGHGSVVLIGGEAGIGKSQLIAEACRRGAAAGLAVRTAAADELERARPFGPMIRAFGIATDAVDERLQQIADLLTTGSPGHAEQSVLPFTAQETIIDVSEELALAGGVLIAIDDLQWCDPATVTTLAALARRASQLPLLLLLAHRRKVPSEVDRLIDHALRAEARALSLGSLLPEEVAQLVGQLVGAPPGPTMLAMVAGARGNPFYVTELVRSLLAREAVDTSSGAAEVLDGELAPTLRQTILRRVRALSPTALTVLRAASVLGRPFDVEELAAVLDRPPVSLHDDVLAGLAVGLLEEDGPRLRIRHDLIREALYADAPEAVRSSLHRKAAQVLTGLGAPAAVVAPHLAAGAVEGEAADLLQQVAREVSDQDPAMALSLLDQAIEAATGASATLDDLHADRVRLLAALGRLAEAEGAANAALAAQPAPLVEARLQVALGEVLLKQGDARGAVARFELAQRSRALDPGERAAVLADTAWARLLSFDLDGARADAAAALHHAGEPGGETIASRALAIQSRLAAYAADFEAAIELGRAAVAADQGSSVVRHTPELHLGLALLNADRAEEAVAVLTEGRQRAEAAGVPWAIASFLNGLIMCGFHSGAWDDATARAEAARALHVDAGTRSKYLQMESMLGLMWFHQGRHDQARDALARAEDDFAAPGHDSGGLVWLLWLQAAFAELDGDVAQAADLLGHAFDLAVGLQVHSVKLWYGPEAVRLALAAGAVDRAKDISREVADAATRARTQTALGAAAWCEGLLAADAQRLRAAAGHYRCTDRCFDLARVQEALGGVLVEDDAADAAAALEESLDLWEALGAQHDARRVAAILRGLGVRRGARGPRARPSTGLASLTPTERRVLELVGSGLRNTEIAARLYVSRRTVETHVGRLYAKLQVSGRVALAQLATAADEPPR